PVAGANGDVANPFFSPDGEWIGFWSISDSRIKKVATTGGKPISITQSRALFGAAWGGDQIIFGERGRGVMAGSTNSGQPNTTGSVKAEEGPAGEPQLIDGGRALLFTLTTGEGPDRWDQGAIVAQLLPSGERKVVFRGGSDAHYLSSGHIIYAQRGNILAAPF